ncbi:hypothetical protein VN0935_14700 [Helicobacter pylori]
MKQRVRTVSYLARAEFKFKNGVYDLVALPSGAEVVKVSLEVIDNPNVHFTGDVLIGFKDENQKDYFLTLSDVGTKGCVTSVRDYTAVSNKVIVAEVKVVKQEQKNKVIVEEVKQEHNEYLKGVLRVLYFLPSETEVEY